MKMSEEENMKREIKRENETTGLNKRESSTRTARIKVKRKKERERYVVVT